MSILKVHQQIPWRNETEPAINEKNLNQYDHELDTLDDRIIDLYSTKLPAQDAGHFITDLDVNQEDGVITVTFYSGRKVRYDTNLEKIPFNYRFDEKSQIFYIIADDGTEQICNLSSLISQYEFQESDGITFDVSSDGKVRANIKKGSVTEELLQPNFLGDCRIEAARAVTGAEAAAGSALEAENNATTAGNAAAMAETSAAGAAANAAQVADSVEIIQAAADEAATSAAGAAASATQALSSAEAAQAAAGDATTSAAGAAVSAAQAFDSASMAEIKALEVADYADLSKSYAVGTNGQIREGDNTDCAEYYYEQSKRISQSISGVIPMGTLTFDELSNTDNQKSGYLFNISDSFVSDERFADGGGIFYGAGNNVLYTADDKWDVLASAMVTGVKGEAETEYRQGFVNITKDNIGLGNIINERQYSASNPQPSVEGSSGSCTGNAATATKAAQDAQGNDIAATYLKKTGDSQNNTITFTSGDSANPTGWANVDLIISGEKHSSLWRKISLFSKNVRYLWKLLGGTSLTGIGDGTVTGAISSLNMGIGNHVLYRDFNSGIYNVPSGASIKDFPLPTISGYIPIAFSPTSYYYQAVWHNLVMWTDKITVQTYNFTDETQNISISGRIVYLKIVQK